MSIITEKERLVRNVVRLRRAERASLAREEIVAVRTDLERTIGPTVARAMAARLLGVSQTALDRWVVSGDVPVVVTRTGRREVPLHALVELVGTVEERKRSGETRHPLASVLHEHRSDAERLDTDAVLPDRYRHSRGHGHRGAELRSLAYHRAVARRLDDQIVRDAQDRVLRWRDEGRINPRYAQEWEKILSRPLARIAKLIGEDTQRARDLRQNSPLAGALSEPERRRVLSTVDEASR